MNRIDAWRMIQRRAAELGYEVKHRLPHFPRDRHHGLSGNRRHVGKRAIDGRA